MKYHGVAANLPTPSKLFWNLKKKRIENKETNRKIEVNDTLLTASHYPYNALNE